jgi:protein-S-isoprenylcysteine O-methyltransferase Ste14
MFKRLLAFAYGLACYAVFLGVFLYAIGFIGNLWVPKSIDSAPQVPFGQALLINLALLALFALQHSGMARPAFKRVWMRFVPKPVERSTYVMATNLCLIALFAFWQPMGGVVWNVPGDVARAALYGVYFAGWGVVLLSTFLINHFDLFGLRQVWLHLRGREYSRLLFTEPLLYRWVRHPLYVGWLMVFWAAPTMTIAHLFFAAVTTAYILVAIRLEERDLVAEHGDAYEEYRRRVPMLVPRLAGRSTLGQRKVSA